MAIQKLKKNEDFRSVFRNGIRKEGQYFYLYLAPKQQKSSRIGIIVKKEIGNAVQRNRIKRLLREIFRKRYDDLFSLNDMIVMVKQEILHTRLKEIEDEFEHIMRE